MQDNLGASQATGLAGAEAPEPPSRLGPSGGIPCAGTVTIPREAYDFLMGTGPLEGVWFGELHEGFPGAFWWRGVLASAAGWPEPAASCDTHPEGGDVKQAPSLMGSAVGEAETPKG